MIRMSQIKHSYQTGRPPRNNHKNIMVYKGGVSGAMAQQRSTEILSHFPQYTRPGIYSEGVYKWGVCKIILT